MTKTPNADARLTSARASAQSSPPNVLLIVLDDAGWGDLGCYKSTIAQTPAIDALAARGVRFQTFCTAAPVCGPSRVGLLSGRNPAMVGITANPTDAAFDAGWNRVRYLSRNAPSLPRTLRDAGWATGHFGKLHIGQSSWMPRVADYGIGTFWGWASSVADDAPYRAWAPSTGAQLFPAPMTQVFKDGPDDEYRLIDEKATAEALTFVQSCHAGGQRWFATLCLNAPHTPLDPRPEDRDAIVRGRPFWSRSDEPLHSPDQFYYGALRSADQRCLAPLLAWLDSSGETENTIVILTSDNGAMSSQSHSESLWASGSVGGRSGWKGQLDFGSLLAPAIWSWPGHFGEGMVADQVGYFCDVLPTLCSLLGLPAPSATEGEDISHALVAPSTSARQWPLLWCYPQVGSEQAENATPPLAALSASGEWFLQGYTDPADPTVLRQQALYHIPTDPGQERNLWPASGTGVPPEGVALMDRLASFAARHCPPGLPGPAGLAWTRLAPTPTGHWPSP